MEPSATQVHKIAVIGTINRDTVIRADGSKHEGFGGILYNLAILSAFAPTGSVIAPVVNVGKDCRREIGKRLANLERLDLSGVRVVNKKNNHCRLRYSDSATKTEVLKGWVGGVTRRQLRGVLDASMILVNFISGADISGRNLRWLRHNFRGEIFMDFHSRTLGRRPDGRRFLRRPRDWKEYLACADIVQMNEIEFELLSGNQVTRRTTCEFLLEHMKKSHCLVVTRGAEGCVVVRRRGKSATTSLIQSFRVETVVDTTGCGDVFSAGFVADYMISHSPISAAGYGNRLAGARCRLGDIFKVDIAQLLSVRAATSKGDFRTPKRNI